MGTTRRSNMSELSHLFPTQTTWVEEIANIPYSEHPSQTLDLYRPARMLTANRPAPCVVFVHGGAWLRDKQRKASAKCLARQLVVEAGVCVLVVGYRLSWIRPSRYVALSLASALLLGALVFLTLTSTLTAFVSHSTAQSAAAICFASCVTAALLYWLTLNRTGATFPEQPNDVAATVRWAKEHIAEHGGDPDCVLLAGHSAGAHLAALVALDEQFETGSVRGVVGISGIYHSDLHSGGSCLWAILVDAVWRNLLDTVFGDSKQWAASFASPHVKACSEQPSFLIVTAERELVGLQRQADDFVSDLTDCGLDVQQLLVPATNHKSIMSSITNPATECVSPNPVVSAICQFISHVVLERKLHAL